MHELGLLRGVVATVDQAARGAGADHVEAVGLRVGTLSGAQPDALHGAWPLATIGTPLEGATLVIEEITAAVRCPTCQSNQPIDEYYAWTCPTCGTPTADLVAGREFEIAWADVPDRGGRPEELASPRSR